MIPEDDRGLLLGDGLFETVLAVAGTLVDFEAHLQRMIRGCAVIGLEAPDPLDAATRARRALTSAGLEEQRAAVRLTLTAGQGRGLDRPAGTSQRLLAMAAPAPGAEGEARLKTVSIRRNETSPLSRLKTLSYLDNVLAHRQAKAAGGDAALMLNTCGEIAGSAAASLFWIAQDRLFTPALECGVLDGIVRARVLERAATLGIEAAQVREGPRALEGAQAAFLTSSLIGVRAVIELDGRALGPHRMIEALSSPDR